MRREYSHLANVKTVLDLIRHGCDSNTENPHVKVALHFFGRKRPQALSFCAWEIYNGSKDAVQDTRKAICGQ